MAEHFEKNNEPKKRQTGTADENYRLYLLSALVKSRKNWKSLVVKITLASVLTSFFTGLLLWFNEQGVYKLEMPGTYVVDLQQGCYGVWNFWQWPTKGLNWSKPNDSVTHETMQYSIIDSEGRSVKLHMTPNLNERTPGDAFLWNFGREESAIDLFRSGKYTVSSSNKGILVIVPAAKYYFSGRDEFLGAYDDFNFLCRPRNSK